MHNSPESTEQGAKFALTALGDELRAEPEYAQSGHTSRTLVRSDDLRIVLTVLASNARIPKHQAPSSASIQVLSGKLRLTLPAGPLELEAGELLVLQGGLTHDVIGVIEATFLQTLAWK